MPPAPLRPALRPRYPVGGDRGRANLALAAIGVVVLLAFLLDRDRRPTCGFSSKEDVAGLTVKKYVWEAYPQWAVDNPARACPDRLDELDRFMNRADGRDPWNSPYRWSCDPRNPSLVVWSIGEDHIAGTTDDIRSDR